MVAVVVVSVTVRFHVHVFLVVDAVVKQTPREPDARTVVDRRLWRAQTLVTAEPLGRHGAGGGAGAALAPLAPAADD